MAHIELPLKDHSEGKHITLLHFPRDLNSEEAAVIVEGMAALGAFYGDYMYDMSYGEKVFFGPAYNRVPAATVELGTNALTDFRERLLQGIRSKLPRVPISQDYGTKWEPHVTNPPFDIMQWSPIHYHRELRLVIGEVVIPVPFADAGEEPNPRIG